MSEDPIRLLDEMAGLRKRARGDRHGYWFPLLLFGLLSFAAMPLYRPFDWSKLPTNGVYVETTGFNPLTAFDTSRGNAVEDPIAVSVYWAAVLVFGFLATVWWYRWRAGRVGVETPTRPYVLAMACALAVPFVGVPVLMFLELRIMWIGYVLLYSVWATAWIGAVALIAAVVAALGHEPPLWRRIVAIVSTAIAMVTASSLILVSPRGQGQFLAIAVGLLALAWVERSRLFGAIAVTFAIAALLANLYDMGNVYWRLGIGDFAAEDILLPAVVLVAGGIAGLIAHRKVAP